MSGTTIAWVSTKVSCDCPLLFFFYTITKTQGNVLVTACDDNYYISDVYNLATIVLWLLQFPNSMPFGGILIMTHDLNLRLKGCLGFRVFKPFILVGKHHEVLHVSPAIFFVICPCALG